MTAGLILIAVLPFVQILIQRLRSPQSTSADTDRRVDFKGLHNVGLSVKSLNYNYLEENNETRRGQRSDLGGPPPA
jgi:hypothetical protein